MAKRKKRKIEKNNKLPLSIIGGAVVIAMAILFSTQSDNAYKRYQDCLERENYHNSLFGKEFIKEDCREEAGL